MSDPSVIPYAYSTEQYHENHPYEGQNYDIPKAEWIARRKLTSKLELQLKISRQGRKQGGKAVKKFLTLDGKCLLLEITLVMENCTVKRRKLVYDGGSQRG